jgi:hypothetical protein
MSLREGRHHAAQDLSTGTDLCVLLAILSVGSAPAALAAPAAGDLDSTFGARIGSSRTSVVTTGFMRWSYRPMVGLWLLGVVHAPAAFTELALAI